MLNIKDYGSSSDDSSDSETIEKEKVSDPSLSVAKTLQICAAPDVVPRDALGVSRAVDPTVKELPYNPKFEELFAPVQGPVNPFVTDQMKAPKNTLAGYIEKAHVNAFQFENQRRTFHTYGYALDPSVDGENTDGQNFVGDLQSAYDTEGKTVFESPKPRKKRKQQKNDDPADIEGFLGPWGKYVDEKTIARPSEKEKAELEEILAKRHKRGRIPEDKPLEEKSILHSKFYNNGDFVHR